MAPNNPQVVSNYLAIVFGIAALIVTISGILITVRQYRQTSKQLSMRSNDTEMFHVSPDLFDLANKRADSSLSDASIDSACSTNTPTWADNALDCPKRVILPA